MTEPVYEVGDVTARNVRLRVVANGKGPPVILLHDFLMSRLAWDDVVPGFAESFRVVAPDLPGFGESEKPPPTRFTYGVEAFVECLVDLIAALDLGRAHVIGHGMSGAIALTLAAEYPEFVDKLVLVGPHVYARGARGVGLGGAALLRAPLLGAFFFRQLYGRARFRAYFRDRVFAPAFAAPASRIDSFYDLFNTPLARQSAFATMHALEDTRATTARLSRIKSPTFVVWGRLDAVYPYQFGQRLAREVGAERFEVMNTGHAPQIEQPEAFVATVGAFLRRRST